VAAGAGAAGAAGAAAPRPFADVIKDAKPVAGLFTVWQKDEKFWLELKPSDLNQPFFLSPKLKTGLGEGRFFGGLMGDEQVIEFRRVHNQIQMLARNTEFVAAAGTPTGRSVAVAFSPSLLPTPTLPPPRTSARRPACLPSSSPPPGFPKTRPCFPWG
jgi:hypothetical protein